MPDRPVIVTGAAGFAGRHLLDLLAEESRPILALVRPGAEAPPAAPPADAPTRTRWISADLLDRPTIERIVARARPAAIYHFAAASHVGRSWERVTATFEVNVRGTQHVLDAVRRHAPDARVLVPGSAMVYRPSTEPLTEDSAIGPTSPYGLSKLAQEMLCRRAVTEDGLEILVTRSFNHAGPRQSPSFSTSSFARQIALIEAGLAPPVLLVGNLDARRDLTDVRDMVRAYRILVDRGDPGRVYNVCSGECPAMSDVLGRLLRLTSLTVSLVTDHERLRPNDVPVVLGSNARIRTELGWEPQLPLDRTLADLLAYWRAQPAASASP